MDALYNISDAILSKSKTNTGNDAIGQKWYVVSEGYYYRLDNWANRRQASGWRKLQNTDEEFDNLQDHGADKIKSFTTTDSTVSLNYNTWKDSTTSVDGSVTIPAATGDQAGVLTANGKDQLTQLNKLGEITHLKDDGVFTEEASTVTIHYDCINTKEGATSEVVTKSEAIPEATLTNAGVLSAAKRNQLEQLDKIGEVTHLDDSEVFTTDTNTATLHYSCVDTGSGANSEVSTKTAVIPEATLTNAGMLAASNRNQLESLNTIGKVSHIPHSDLDSTDAFTSTGNEVTMHWQCINVEDNSELRSVDEHSTNLPVASTTSAGTMSAADKINLDETLPQAIEQEIADRKQAIEDLENKVNGDISVKLNQEITDRKAGDNNLIEQLGFDGEAGSATYSPVNVDINGLNVTQAIDFLADEKYRSEMPDGLEVPNNLGGLKAGQTAADLKKKSISQILDDLIFPELQPTVTAPSASISFTSGFSNNQILEVNATAPQSPTNFITGYSQGSSKVAGQSDKKRGGSLISGSSFIYYGTASVTTLPTKVVLGTMSYRYRAAYEEGELCITSKGNKASIDPNPLSSGTVDSGTIQIYGTYPYFCNGQSASSSSQDTNFPSTVTDNTKLPLQKWTDTLVGAKFASEASTGTRIVFDFPSTKRVTKVEFMNTVSGKWENFSGWSTSTTSEKIIQSVSVAYSRLTTTGALSGAIQLRFTIANA